MNKETRRQAILAFLILGVFIFSCNSFGDPIVGAQGTVRDRNGNPLKGVYVMLEKAGATPRRVVTETDGAFDVFLIGANFEDTKISFTKSGYQTVEKRFEKLGKENFDVTLEEIAK